MKKLLLILSALCVCSQGYPQNHPYNNVVRSESNLNEGLPVGNPSKSDKFERIAEISSEVLTNSLFDAVKTTDPPKPNPTDPPKPNPTNPPKPNPTNPPKPNPTDPPKPNPTNPPKPNPTNPPKPNPTDPPKPNPTDPPKPNPTDPPKPNPTDPPKPNPTDPPKPNPTDPPTPTKSPNGGAMSSSSFSTLSAVVLIQLIWKYLN